MNESIEIMEWNEARLLLLNLQPAPKGMVYLVRGPVHSAWHKRERAIVAAVRCREACGMPGVYNIHLVNYGARVDREGIVNHEHNAQTLVNIAHFKMP